MWGKLNRENTGITRCDVINDPKSRSDYVILDISFYYKLTSIKLRKYLEGTQNKAERAIINF